MPFFKYVGDTHTQVRLEKNGDKVKVREGEIIESDLDPKYFLGNNFHAVEEMGEEVQSLTIGEIKAKLSELGIEIPKKAKKEELEALLAQSQAVEVAVEDDGTNDITISVENAEDNAEDTGESAV